MGQHVQAATGTTLILTYICQQNGQIRGQFLQAVKQ